MTLYNTICWIWILLYGIRLSRSDVVLEQTLRIRWRQQPCDDFFLLDGRRLREDSPPVHPPTIVDCRLVLHDNGRFELQPPPHSTAWLPLSGRWHQPPSAHCVTDDYHQRLVLQSDQRRSLNSSSVSSFVLQCRSPKKSRRHGRRIVKGLVLKHTSGSPRAAVVGSFW